MLFSKALYHSSWESAIRSRMRKFSQSEKTTDILLFLKAWIAHPAKVGAILPSGAALSAAITDEIHAGCAPVLELGSGTGAFTQQIIQRGVAAKDLILVESDPRFASHLCTRFPDAKLLGIDACRLNHTLPADLKNSVGAVVCGLPLRNVSTRQQIRILRGAFDSLREQGAVYLFSYGWRCPIPPSVLERLGLQASELNWILLNVPPAKIWKISR